MIGEVSGCIPLVSTPTAQQDFYRALCAPRTNASGATYARVGADAFVRPASEARVCHREQNLLNQKIRRSLRRGGEESCATLFSFPGEPGPRPLPDRAST